MDCESFRNGPKTISTFQFFYKQNYFYKIVQFDLQNLVHNYFTVLYVASNFEFCLGLLNKKMLNLTNSTIQVQAAQTIFFAGPKCVILLTFVSTMFRIFHLTCMLFLKSLKFPNRVCPWKMKNFFEEIPLLRESISLRASIGQPNRDRAWSTLFVVGLANPGWHRMVWLVKSKFSKNRRRD